MWEDHGNRIFFGCCSELGQVRVRVIVRVAPSHPDFSAIPPSPEWSHCSPWNWPTVVSVSSP